MKARSLVIGFLLLAIVVSCTSKVKVVEPVETPSSELCAIDSLMWRQPDSALAQLQRFVASPAADSLDVFNGHYCQLLISELLYKNDWGQSNREELLKAVGYFDSIVDLHGANIQKRNAFLDARAHYINGVGYYEHDSVVEACKEYLKALEVMEEHFEEKELVEEKAKFIALTYTHLTGLFSDMYLHEQAIFFGKLSLHYFYKYGAFPQHIAWSFDEIGLHFDILHNYDSAEYYYKEGVMVLSDTNSLSYRDIMAHLAFLSYKKGNDIKPSLHQLFSILSQSESKQEYASRCLTIGEIYYHEREFDSAWIYLNNVFDLSEIIGAKKQAAEWLVEICKAEYFMCDVSKYAEFLLPFANQEENNSGLKSQLIELHNKYEQKDLEQRHHREIMKHATQGLLALVGLLIILVIIVILYRKNKRSRKKLEVQMEVERQAHKIQQAALAGRLKRSNAALREQDKKKTRDPQISSIKGQIVVENYADEPICQHILTVCNDKNKPIKSSVPVSAYKDIALSDAQKAQLKEAATRHYSVLFKKLIP